MIFAGYPNEMERFLSKNPGLRSRIAFHVPFEDYDTEELCAIAEHMASDMGFSLDTGARERLAEVFDTAADVETPLPAKQDKVIPIGFCA